ncbi:perivitellin-2 31 kDa subunit-like [Asterias amurensis]|uniref:perivitellin-2 31 kDa subunit-like n=1 Tax=Asterias amurensis TaxID=7602 RepID=UPI003AB561B7
MAYKAICLVLMLLITPIVFSQPDKWFKPRNPSPTDMADTVVDEEKSYEAVQLCPCARLGWQSIPGGLIHVSIGSSGVWGANSNGNIYFREGSYGNEQNTGATWIQVSGGLSQLDVGKNVVWGVNSNDNIYARQGITSGNPTGTGWSQVGGALKHVSVSQKGHVWGVNSGDNIYHRLGASNCNVLGNDWRQIGGGLKQISVGSGGVWGVNSADSIYYREGTFGDPDSDPDGSTWTRVSGALKYISSGDDIYGVNSNNNVYYRLGVSAAAPKGTDWQNIPGGLSQIESLSLAVWGVNTNGNIYVKETD